MTYTMMEVYRNEYLRHRGCLVDYYKVIALANNLDQMTDEEQLASLQALLVDAGHKNPRVVSKLVSKLAAALRTAGAEPIDVETRRSFAGLGERPGEIKQPTMALDDGSHGKEWVYEQAKEVAKQLGKVKFAITKLGHDFDIESPVRGEWDTETLGVAVNLVLDMHGDAGTRALAAELRRVVQYNTEAAYSVIHLSLMAAGRYRRHPVLCKTFADQIFGPDLTRSLDPATVVNVLVNVSAARQYLLFQNMAQRLQKREAWLERAVALSLPLGERITDPWEAAVQFLAREAGKEVATHRKHLELCSVFYLMYREAPYLLLMVDESMRFRYVDT